MKTVPPLQASPVRRHHAQHHRGRGRGTGAGGAAGGAGGAGGNTELRAERKASWRKPGAVGGVWSGEVRFWKLNLLFEN